MRTESRKRERKGTWIRRKGIYHGYVGEMEVQKRERVYGERFRERPGDEKEKE